MSYINQKVYNISKIGNGMVSKQNIGNAGEYYIASILSAKDFIALTAKYDIFSVERGPVGVERQHWNETLVLPQPHWLESLRPPLAGKPPAAPTAFWKQPDLARRQKCLQRVRSKYPVPWFVTQEHRASASQA